MAEFGFSGIDRYLAAPLAIVQVLGGAGLAWLLSMLIPRLRRSTLAAAAAAVVVAATVVGFARAALDWPRMMRIVSRNGAIVDDLDGALARAGGPRRLRACGHVSASYYVTPVVAWNLRLRLADVTPVPSFPGSVLRTRVYSDRPLDPPLGGGANAPGRPVPGRPVVSRTARWEIQVVCRPAGVQPLARGGRASPSNGPISKLERR
jgi:hypothetical protein